LNQIVRDGKTAGILWWLPKKSYRTRLVSAAICLSNFCRLSRRELSLNRGW